MKDDFDPKPNVRDNFFDWNTSPLYMDDLLSPLGGTWIYPRYLPARGIGYLFGLSQIGKTWVVVDLLVAIASGSDFAQVEFNNPHATTEPEIKAPLGVLYVTNEGDFNDLQKRFIAAATARLPLLSDCNDRLPLPIRVLQTSFSLDGANSIDAFVNKLNKSDNINGVRLGMIVFDTLSSVVPVTSENDAATVSALNRKLTALSESLDCFVMAVRHASSKSRNTAEMTGSTMFYNAADTVWNIEGKIGLPWAYNLRLVVAKSRSGPLPSPQSFRLVAHPDEQTAALTVLWDGEIQSAGGGKQIHGSSASSNPVQRPSRAETFLAALNSVMAETDGAHDPAKSDSPGWVALAAVRERFFAEYPGETRGAKEKAYERAVRLVNALGLIEESNVDRRRFVRFAPARA